MVNTVNPVTVLASLADKRQVLLMIIGNMTVQIGGYYKRLRMV